jgi:hypothetical protein
MSLSERICLEVHIKQLEIPGKVVSQLRHFGKFSTCVHSSLLFFRPPILGSGQKIDSHERGTKISRRDWNR